jgi:gliding motility-associated-like protein
MKCCLPAKFIFFSIVMFLSLNIKAACNLSSICALKADTAICANKTTRLANCSDAANFNYKWRGLSASPLSNLSDTAIGNPNFSSAATGTFIYTVTATRKTDATCFLTDTITIIVNQAAVIPSIALQKTCAGDTLKFSIAQRTGETYAWSGPASYTGTGSTVARPNASALYNGSYSVTVTATGGCRVLTAKTITISSPVVNAGRDTSACKGTNIKIGSNPTAQGGIAPYTYAWNAIGDTLSSNTIANPVASPGQNSLFMLSITDSAGCTAGPDTMKIIVGTCNQICEGAKGPNLLSSMGTFSTPYIIPNNTTSDACIRSGGVSAPLDNIGSAKPTQTSYTYAKTSGGMGPEGTYTFVKTLGTGSTGNCMHGDFRGADHTGDGGYFMAINGSPNINSYGATFFKLDSIEVCPNTDYEFSAWVTNLKTGMQTHGANSYPNIAFFINDVIVASSGDVMPTTGQWANNWRKSGGTWFSDNTRYANIRIDNYTFVASGNDLGLDDINFGICGPVIISRTSKNIYCENEYVKVRDSVACTNGRTYSYYRWQRSTDGGNNWTFVSPLGSSNNSAFYPVALDSFKATLAMDGYQYRVAVALDSNSLLTSDADCTIYGNATTIRVRPLPNVTIQTSDTICPNIAAVLTGMGSSGTQPFTYTWTNNLNSIAATGQTYSLGVSNPINIYVTLSDSIGCIAKDSTTLIPAPLFTTAADSTNVLCFGGNTGTAIVTATGASNPYSISWMDGNASFTRNNLIANTYTYAVTDRFGCIVNGSAAITQPAALAATATTQAVSCYNGNNGTISQTVTGGTAPYSFKWNDSTATQNRTALANGSHTVTITDANGCTLSKTYSIANTDSIVVTGTRQDVKCNGAATGAVTLAATGGTAPYTYIWNNAAVASAISNLAAGAYSATVTDNKGCSKTATFTITQPAAALSATTTATPVSCFGGNTGSATVTAAGGTSPYTYAWSNAATTASISSLAAATYSITVKDANNCTTATAATVTQPAASISATLAKADISCNAGSNGTITTTVTGGTTPYSYSWNSGVTTKDRTALVAAAYAVTVTDANGCSTTKSITLTEPTVLSLSSTTTDVSCNGLGNGAINLTVSGGTTPYNYIWSNAATTQNISALAPGTYTVTVTDAGTCSKIQNKTITQPAAALSATTNATPVSCFGGSTGSVTVTAAGGTPPYTYAWSNAATTASISSLAAATYSVTVKDANNCTFATSATVTQPAASISATLAKTNISCNAGSNGTITTTVAGGTAPYSYSWNNGAATKDRTALVAAAYTVTIKDANNCSTTKSITLIEPAALSVSSTTTDVSCNGLGNGVMNLAVAGGITPYSYVWSNNAITQNIASILPGSYTVTVTDANSCSKILTKTIFQPTALTVSLNSGNTACTTPIGTATAVTNNSGTAPYTYTWSNGAASSQNINGLAPGSISVTVTDAKGCTAEATTSIALSNNNTDASFTTGGSHCAPNASVTFTHNGSANPLAHTWAFGVNGDSSALTSPGYTYPTAGTYTVTHIVKRGFCSDTVAKTVTITNAPVASAVSLNVKCFGGNTGAIATTITNGTSPFTYSWSNGQSTTGISNLTAGAYSVTVSDAVGCSDTLSTIISQPAALSTSAIIKNTSCNAGTNGSILLSSSGDQSNHQFIWSNGATTKDITDLSAGTYSVTVSDINNCTIASSYTVSSPSLLAITATATPASCFGGNNGAVKTTISGGTAPYSYNWEAGITTKNRAGLIANTYTVIATDSNGCTATAAATVAQPGLLNIQLTAADAKCFGSASGNVSCTATGGTSPYKFKWSTGDTTQNISNKAAAAYTVTITDANGCTAAKTATIAQPATLAATFTTAQPGCYNGNNGSATVAATGGTSSYTIAWSNGGASFTHASLSAGNYTATITDANNCSITKNISITQPDSIKLSIIANTSALCFGAANATVTIAATGGTPAYTISWNDGSSTFARNNLSAGSYQATVSDSKACTKTIALSTTQAAQLNATITTKNVSCFNGNNGSAKAIVTGGTLPYTYSFSSNGSADSSSYLPEGNYSVTITDANSCSLIKTFSIAQPDSIAVTLSATGVKCFGGNDGSMQAATTGGTAPYTYKWSNGPTIANITALSRGTYTITIKDANSCSLVRSGTVDQPAALISSAVAAMPSCFGGNNGSATISASGATAPYQYKWSNGSATANRNGLGAGTYRFSVTDANGCIAIDSVSVSQPDSIKLSITANIPARCFGVANATATIAAAGGTPAYTISWSDGGSTFARNDLSAGSYQVTVSDSKACTKKITFTTIQAAQLGATISAKDVSCFNGSNGSANASVTGGTVPFAFSWSNGSSTDTATNLAKGTYTLTITDASGCTLVKSVSVNQPDSLSVSGTATAVACFGGNNGSVSTTTTGGTAPYTYKWSDAKATAAIQNLAAASYSLTVTDKKGCTATEDFTVSQPDSISIAATVQQPLCFNAANGNITVAATGGNGGYVYQWSNNKATATNSAIAAGAYSIVITDAKDCSANRSFAIGQPAALATADSATGISCFGANDGRINITATGGTAPYSINWSNGSHSPSLSNLGAGTYTVTVTDAAGCSIIKAAQVVEPQKLTLATATKDVSCFNGSNGAATVKALGGIAPYSFVWSNTSANDTISNLAAGSYAVTAKDANACTAAATVNIAQPAILSAGSTSADVACFGGSTGSINVTTAGGTAPYTIKWSDNATAFARQGLAKGNYSATITDANSCTTTIADSITGPVKITISITTTDVLCNGGNSGAIATVVAGGTAPYAFAWSDGSNQQNRTALIAGSYKLTVTDNAGCTASGNAVVITQPATLSAQLTAKKTTCYNGSNGRAIAAVTGGTAPYSFVWNNAGTSDTISNLAAGTYTVTITDGNACSTTKSVSISQPDSLTLNAVITAPLCNGAATGSLFFNSVSGGTPGYVFKWSNGVQQADLNNIGAGTYTLTVTDNAGCNTSRPFTIIQPAGIAVQLSVTQNKCFGDSAATISVSAAGGSGSLSYKWSNGKTSAAINTLKAGNYAVTIKDQNNCTIDTSIAITQPVLITANASTKNNKCFGQANGSIALHTAGGVQPYSIKWNTGATTDSISALVKGTYTVTITDANNCAIIHSFNITQPDTLHLGITATNPNCASQKSGMVMFNSISGGTPSYTFLWSNGQLSSELTNVGAGTYQVTITDLNGCTTSKSYTLTQPDSMMATAIITNPACSGTAAGNINLTVTGGTAPFIYNWSNGKVTQDLQNINAGSYSVQISDSKGCYITGSYIVAQPAPISFPATGSTTDVACNGGSNGAITTSVSGGNTPYTYSWSNGATTANLSNVVAGTYTVTITDAGSCTAKKQFTLNQPAAMVVGDSVKNISCNGLNNGSIKLKVVGGNTPYTYTWNTAGNTANISTLAPGTYNVTVSDNKNCSVAKSYTITQPVALAVQGTASPVKCAGSNDGKVLSITSGGTLPYTYKWNTNEAKDSITGKVAGSYTLSVSDARGCTASAAFTITTPAPLALGNAKNDITCFGKRDGVINLNVQGGTPGYTYTWSNGMTVNRVANLAKGKYYVTVKDRNNCAAKDSSFITEPSPVQLAATIKDVRCFGDKNGTVSISVSGGAQPYNYSWSNGGSTAGITQLGADKYYVTVTDAALCTNVGVATISQPAAIGNSFAVTANKCFGDSTARLAAKANGGKAPYSYAWSTGSSNDTLFNLAANLYTVSITDANGCSITDTASVTAPRAVIISTEVMDASCEGKSDGSALVTATFGTAPYTYVWAGGGTGAQARNLAKASYYVTVTDANGCSKSAEVVVNEFPSVKAEAEVQHIGCKPGTDGQVHLTPVGGKGPYRYTWSNGGTTSAISTAQGGNFAVTITDRNGCAYDTAFTIQAATGISINTIPAKTIKLGESVALTTTGSSQNITAWSWTPDYSEAGLDCDNCQSPGAAPTKTTTYHVTAIDDRGCEAHDTVTLTVIPDHSFFVPNLFSPNGDGDNDYFSFYGNMDGIAKFNVLIFNRWGEKIFDSNDPGFKWDGTYKNVPQDPGVYVYVITLVFKDNAKPDDDMKGSITIVR